MKSFMKAELAWLTLFLIFFIVLFLFDQDWLFAGVTFVIMLLNFWFIAVLNKKMKKDGEEDQTLWWMFLDVAFSLFD